VAQRSLPARRVCSIIAPADGTRCVPTTSPSATIAAVDTVVAMTTAGCATTACGKVPVTGGWPAGRPVVLDAGVTPAVEPAPALAEARCRVALRWGALVRCLMAR